MTLLRRVVALVLLELAAAAQVLERAQVIPGLCLLALVTWPTHAPRSTHGSTHGPLPDYVTHVSPTVDTVEGITAARGCHGSSHAMHAAGPCTESPPSLQGGSVRTGQDQAL